MPEFLTSRAEKRKSQDESTKDSENSEDNKNSFDSPGLFNPRESLSVEIPAKKGKTTTITLAAVSPVLLECPEQDCGKKYKHVNGLKYHQSHAHGGGSIDEDSEPTPESPLIAPSSPASAFTNHPQKEPTLSRQDSQTETANHSRSPTPTSTSTSTATPTVTPTRTPSPTNSPSHTPAPTPPPESNFSAKAGTDNDSGAKSNLPTQMEAASGINVTNEASKVSINTASESTDTQGTI